MARRLTTDQEINAFINSVLNEAQHHAPGVAAIIQPLSDNVRAHLNLAIDRIDVYERNGQIARTCWVTINGNRYAFSYNYDDEAIDLREGSIQGPTKYQFNNDTTDQEIQNIVAGM
jgi:hypothetical protein